MIQQPQIPNDWTPEQALTIYEFIDELRDAIWHRYDLQLIELMREDRVTSFDTKEDVTF